jgi:hypothetical protein
MNAQNQLVQNTRDVGAALRSGDMSKLKELAQTIGKAGGSISSASNADLGNRPAQLTNLTKQNAGSQNDANHRSITQDRPPPSHGHGR